jgi:hypothetical protein
MLKKALTAALLSAFALAITTPGFAQNQTDQGSQNQAPGASPGDNSGTQTPHQKSKKKKRHSSAGHSNQSDQGDSAHPGNSNQVGVPTTQPGGTGTQSGANPAGPPSSSSGNAGGTSR